MEHWGHEPVPGWDASIASPSFPAVPKLWPLSVMSFDGLRFFNLVEYLSGLSLGLFVSLKKKNS